MEQKLLNLKWILSLEINFKLKKMVLKTKNFQVKGTSTRTVLGWVTLLEV
jgi:hypothetical protein